MRNTACERTKKNDCPYCRELERRAAKLSFQCGSSPLPHIYEMPISVMASNPTTLIQSGCKRLAGFFLTFDCLHHALAIHHIAFGDHTRIEIAKLFLINGANPNLECDRECLYDYVTFKVFNEMGDPDWDYLLRFYKLLIAYGGGGYGYLHPVLTEPINKALTDAYDIRFEQCENGYHVQGHVITPDGKEIGIL